MHAPGPSLRLFYALWPDADTRTGLTQLPSNVTGRRMPAQHYHLTLAFLGRQPASAVPMLAAIMDALPAGGMTLRFDRIGVFRRHRILWAGMEHCPAALTALHAALLVQLADHAIMVPGTAAFKPHVTLMRDVDSPPLAPHWPSPPLVWQARELALIASRATPSGASYEVLASRHLQLP